MTICHPELPKDGEGSQDARISLKPGSSDGIAT
jgi:hypothetical protein